MVPMRSACSSNRGFGYAPGPPATLRVATRPNRRHGGHSTFLACCLVLLLGCAHGSGREPAASMLEIATSSADADVWVDGEYVGQVAAVSGKLRLAPGVHRVEIR